MLARSPSRLLLPAYCGKMLKPTSVCKVLPGLGVVLPLVRAEAPKQSSPVLQPTSIRHYVPEFNRNDVEFLASATQDKRSSGRSAIWQSKDREVGFFESTAWFWSEYHDIEVNALQSGASRCGLLVYTNSRR